MKRLTVLMAGLVVTAAAGGRAEEIGYIEDFALAADRTEALKLLIPGSEQYYYYHCLHYQNTEQFDKVEEMLAAWIKRYQETPLVRQIQNRQALLTYPKNPPGSLEHIRRRLEIQFNHQRETIGQKPNLPTQLDQALISRQRLTELAFSRHQNLEGFEDAALDWLAAAELNPDRRRHLLQRLARPDYPNLAKLVVDDLNYRNSAPFGSMAIHQQLLLVQLDQCLELKPDLLNQANFVNIYLAKLRGSNDVDWRNDPQEYEVYLGRLWSFVGRLDPAHNSLKAHVLFHRLVHDRSRGIYDQERFMAYIKLPRSVSYIESKFIQQEESRRWPADLNADFHGVTMRPPVGDDEPLVRSYLHHFFVKETTTKPYEPYISDVYLRRHFAETKIVNGLGEPEQWYSLLAPHEYQALKERIDLDFAYANKTHFAAEEPVGLDLYVKNARTLIVKVFEINADNYYRQQGREVNTDVNLDGLVANDEQTYEYTEPPLRRVRRHFDFPALARPGVYVIDFIGNGISSRAVVGKGKLRHLVRTGTAGHVFTVLDENNQKISDATLWVAGHRYGADNRGHIVVPFTTQPTRQAIVISRGGFSSLDHFQHEAEQYRLAAGFYVDRESLVSGNKARLVVRPALYLNGTPVTLSVLEDVRLTITSVDHDGVSTTKEVSDFKLFEDRESQYEFQTPQRLAQISFALQAKVQNLSQNKKIDLSAGDSFSLNEIDKTEKVEDLHLVHIDGQYFIDLLGKTGEAKPDRPVQLSIKHRDFREAVPLTLQTDLRGRVALGPLDDIASVTATGPEGTSHTWTLLDDDHSYHQSLHSVAGGAIEVPYMGSAAKPERSELSLLEMRGGAFVADRFDALSMGGGMVRVADLPPGDYDLLLKRSGRRIRLRVSAGESREGYVLGRDRHLELRGQRPLQIASVESVQGAVRIQLRNASKFARVHLLATRYQPAFSAFAKLGSIVDAEPYLIRPSKSETLYVAGRNIGDEYRYIIDRKYAKKFPGNMLDRPSLLLNPWAIRGTEAGKQEAAEGEQFAPQSEAAKSEAAREAAPQESEARRGDFANLDFLAEGSAVLLNRVPDEQGVVAIPRDKLGAHQHLHIVAIDPQSTAYRTVSLPEVPSDFRDLRLADGLDPERHFTQQKRISVVGAGEKFVLPDISASKFEVYDSLARVYGLYATLSGDAKLAEFRFILNWPKLEPEKKRELYSKYACHELNFFLYKKEPQFFETVVQPFIENKKDKTFLDRWLVGGDLQSYLQPWNYAQLNVVERILLSQRIDADRPQAVRHIKDLYDLLPPDVDRFNFLFHTALKGSALETADAFGLVAAKERAVAIELEGADALARDRAEAGVRLLAGRAYPKTPAAEVAAGQEKAPPAQPPERRALRLSRQDGRKLAERDRGGAALADFDVLQNLIKESAAPESWAEERDKKSAQWYYAEEMKRRDEVRRLYQKLDKTQEWVENNYYQLPIEQQNAELVTVNAFWRDYAEHDPPQEKPFYSVHLAEACRNFPEMMFALALLDLPFEAAEHDSQFDQAKMTLTAAGPMVVFHEETGPTQDAARATPILVSQNFFRHSDRYRYENNERLDKFVTDEFLVHTAYGCQVVVTNPTSSPQKLDLLLQVPVGAIPVLGGQNTRSLHIDLQPYHTQTIEYHFYFPAAGRYRHYPVHVAKNERLLAHAAPVSLTAVEELSRIDRESWDYVSQYGSDEEVLNFLKQHNLHRIDLEKIAFRMQGKDFFLTVVDLLGARHAYHHTLWSYGIKHNVVPAVQQYLQHADGFVGQCGAYLASPLLVIDPVARKTYQHMDYRPLVNARTHQLGRRRQILNDRVQAQYHGLLTILSCKRELDSDDLMAVTYYMLLQDRIEEAMAFFDRVNAADLETRLQYDLFAAHLSLYRDDIDSARQFAERHGDHPVDRWRTAFAALEGQLDEIAGAGAKVLDGESRDQTQTQLAASEPNFDFQVESKKVTLNYQNLDQVLVNYYLMDIELLFSRNPFGQQEGSQFSHIRPNLSGTVKLPAKRSSFTFPLPGELDNRNVLVEIIGGGQTKSAAYYANRMALQVIDNYGQLRVATANPGEPLSKVYVKVYARMKDGSVRFYKDGYTDLRGRFDYTSLNTNELDFVDKFALLVLSDQHGAVVREANPPKR